MFGIKVVEERASKFNGTVKVVKSLGFGVYIQAEGLTQSGGIVKDIWKKTLNKLKKQKITSVLIFGLGGGTVAGLIKKIWKDAKITGIDIDPVMVEMGKKYLGLGDTQVETIIGDALIESKKLKIKNKKYDLVIVDLYNGNVFPEKFNSDDFISLTKKLLSEDGVAVFNRLYYGDKRPAAVKFGHRLEKNFGKVDWFYPEANLMFICSPTLTS